MTIEQRIERISAWSAPAGLVLLTLGFWVLAGYVPPPPAHDTPLQIAHFYRHNPTGIRIGLLLSFIGLAGWGPLVAVISRLMRRNSSSTLAQLQLISGGAAWMFLMFPLLILAVAAFRPDRAPATTQTLHDLGWILLIMPFLPFVVQDIAIALRVLLDPAPRPLFPRWVGYMNLWVAASFVLAGMLLFFKSGPFSYQGLFCFWIPFLTFGIWIIVMPWACDRAIVAESAVSDVGPRS